MFNITVSEEQLKLLHLLLDTHLKTNGISSLQDAVSIYNVLKSAIKVEQQ